MFQLSLVKMQMKGISQFMSENDAVLYEYVKFIRVIYMDLFLFPGFNRFMHFLSTYANS